jgi:hypothetical protein
MPYRDGMPRTRTAKILYVVKPTVNADAEAAAEKLLADIRRGLTIGFALAAMHKVDLYSLDVAGECTRFPTATRGMVDALHDKLAPVKK